ncbi:hypothetical protein [Geomesophilobacter sediminis]|uniref:Uncharacterized protein n=1 Tax=Geomesophilobacter sediminis TaxID=2798584 RepID=A0A8J7M2R8_9BACT|nr:hypothetical protein [Geomesophilobacter sediminis]MBJ6727577.1 hypothetical protein [Geomesophilobacter sediminis]
MAHTNMIAAILVSGAEEEHFGAVARKNNNVPVWPTDPSCETRFSFDQDGNITGLDQAAKDTVGILKLDHRTLVGWRRAAIETFLSPDVIKTRNDVEELIRLIDQPVGGRLAEFCFVIKSVALAML